MRSDPFYGIEIFADHILLAPFHDAKVPLGVKGPAPNPKAAVADLWEAHRSLVGEWFPFDAFFNRGLPLAELLGSSAAVVADGRVRIIRTYEAALRSHVFNVYSIREMQPQRWIDMSWQSEDAEVQLLLLEPHGYIIGKGFDARRVSSHLLPPVA